MICGGGGGRGGRVCLNPSWDVWGKERRSEGIKGRDKRGKRGRKNRGGEERVRREGGKRGKRGSWCRDK